MRTLVAIVVTLAALSRTGAADDKKCYAGTQTIDGKQSYAIVAVREVDRAASEIRERVWSERNPSREIATTLHIAPDGASFDLVFKSLHGHGTLEGTPWAWTSYHAEITMGHTTMIADGTLRGDTLSVTSSLRSGGKAITVEQIEARAFDCAELDKRRAALDDTAAGAARTCYDGLQTDTVAPHPRHALLVQIVEPHRIKLVRRLAGSHFDTIKILAIDGTAIRVTDPEHSALTGSGTLHGKPGAWTGYTWTGHEDLHDGKVHLVVDGDGTLGGPHATEKIVVGGATHLESTFAGDAFDCKDLDRRRGILNVR